MQLIFHDFEVTPKFWCVTMIQYPNKTKHQFSSDYDRSHGNREDLVKFYEEHKLDIWVGYNNKNYDQWIMKALLCDFDPWEINEWIIEQEKDGWAFSNELNRFSMINYDCLVGYRSLKELEGFMGERIKETPVDFTIDRKLTKKEIKQMFEYNEHDVIQTMNVFFEDTSSFEAMLHLVSEYNLPMSCIGKTKAGIVAQILGCRKQDFNDEWEISVVDTLRIRKYTNVLRWFKDSKNYKMGQKLITQVAGVEHTFGLGGVHGALERFHGKGLFLHVDVASMYPSIMIQYDLLSRAVTKKDLFIEICNLRLALKAAGKKKEQAPYKIVVNSMFGISGAEFSPAYDPRRNHEVCVNGQLLLLDLIEHLEGSCKLIQSNTDGLIIQIADTDAAFDKIDDICYEWEQRTRLKLSFDIITEIFQKDVNNYLFITDEGKIETKGAWLKETNKLDNDLPIIKLALKEYMVNKTPIEETILSCKNLVDFQKIVKRSSKYKYVWHNGNIEPDKTFRVFASKKEEDTFIGKQKTEGATIEKFGNTPDHCFIWNDNVNGVSVPEYLDLNYYIDLAKERLVEFGAQTYV